MELKIEYMALDKLKPYEKNARKHQEADLSTIKASISEFGMSDPIGVWGKDNIIVEGHGRYLACKELGIEEVPVIHLDHLTDEQRRAYALAHNKTAEMSEWDFDLLGDELAEDNKQPYDLCFYKKVGTIPNYKGHLMTDCEYIAVIGKQDPNKGLPKEMYSKCYVGRKDSDNELSYSKPVELCAKYIKLYARQNVLDLFGGSGSTLIACEQLGRNCFMMELDPHYVDVIIARWEKFTGQKAVLLNG